MTFEPLEDNTSSAYSAENKTLEEIISEVEDVIEQISANFTTVRGLILALAKKLNETKQCELGQTCRRIKEILRDKIREGKITEKWIEDCLPQEYKRKYNKSEVSSLSKVGRENISLQQLENEDGGSKEVKVEDDIQILASSPVQSIEKSDTEDIAENNQEQVVSNLLEFEFPLIFKDVREYMASLFPKIGNKGEVWFSGIIDKSTGLVIHAQPDRKEPRMRNERT